MRRLLLLAGVGLSSAAFAGDKEAAQAKIDAAMEQSCTLAKKNVAEKAAECPDEHKALTAVDCANGDARKAVDYLKLNVDCAKRAKTKGEPAEKAEQKPSGGSHCKVVDASGAVVLEHDSAGGALVCQSEIREKVKAAKCTPKAKLALRFVADGTPIALNITCPAK